MDQRKTQNSRFFLCGRLTKTMHKCISKRAKETPPALEVAGNRERLDKARARCPAHGHCGRGREGGHGGGCGGLGRVGVDMEHQNRFILDPVTALQDARKELFDEIQTMLAEEEDEGERYQLNAILQKVVLGS